jgi:predicted nucleic acid-binding protein
VRRAIEDGERLVIATPVLYEWLRAELYRTVRRPRGREIELAIAACALTHEARLWTRNVDDFRDVPGLVVERPR